MIRTISRLKLTLVETGSSARTRAEPAAASAATATARLAARAAVLRIPLVTLIQVGPPGVRIRVVPIQRIAGNAFVQKPALVHVDLGRGAVGVGARVVERTQLRPRLFIALEAHSRKDR